MNHLLRIDSSVRAENSVSRALTARGGYGPGTPRHGCDHAESWLAQGVLITGLTPRIIVAELTMAAVDARMAHLAPLAEESLARAHAEIDALWTIDDESAA